MCFMIDKQNHSYRVGNRTRSRNDDVSDISSQCHDVGHELRVSSGSRRLEQCLLGDPNIISSLENPRVNHRSHVWSKLLSDDDQMDFNALDRVIQLSIMSFQLTLMISHLSMCVTIDSTGWKKKTYAHGNIFACIFSYVKVWDRQYVLDHRLKKTMQYLYFDVSSFIRSRSSEVMSLFFRLTESHPRSFRELHCKESLLTESRQWRNCIIKTSTRHRPLVDVAHRWYKNCPSSAKQISPIIHVSRSWARRQDVSLVSWSGICSSLARFMMLATTLSLSTTDEFQVSHFSMQMDGCQCCIDVEISWTAHPSWGRDDRKEVHRVPCSLKKEKVFRDDESRNKSQVCPGKFYVEVRSAYDTDPDSTLLWVSIALPSSCMVPHITDWKKTNGVIDAVGQSISIRDHVSPQEILRTLEFETTDIVISSQTVSLYLCTPGLFGWYDW